jgi:hypothetical protein
MERIRDKPRVRLSEYLQQYVGTLAQQQGVTRNAMLESLLHLGIASHLLMELSITGEDNEKISTSANN